MARPRSFDEAKVMDAALQAFWNGGYEGTSLDDLTTATGLGKGSLYGAFGDKHKLFLRVVEEYCADSIKDVQAALEGDDAGAYERLRAYLFSIVSSIGRDTENRGCLLAKSSAELAGKDAVIANHALKTYQAIEVALSNCIAQAQRHGDIDAAADPDRLAGMITAVIRGLEALGKAGTDESYLREIADTTLATLESGKGK